MICDYCLKEHRKPTSSYCPERTAAWQRGLGNRPIRPIKSIRDLLDWFRGKR